MTRLTLFAIGLSACAWCSSATAAYVYAQSVASSGPSILDPVQHPLSVALGAPDVVPAVSGGIQFGVGSVLTFDLGSLQTSPGTLSIFTFDTPYPASAQVEISADGAGFSLLAARIWDDTGTTAPPFYASVNLVVTTPFRYVRLTDLGDPGGFDLDAVGFLPGDVQPVPEPASLTLFGLGALGLAVGRRRRLTRNT